MVLYKYSFGAPLYLIDTFESCETKLKTDNIYVVRSCHTYDLFERPNKVLWRFTLMKYNPIFHIGVTAPMAVVTCTSISLASKK